MSNDFIEDSFLLTGLSPKMKRFLEDNQQQLLKIIMAGADKTCTIQIELIRGEIRDGIIQTPLEV